MRQKVAKNLLKIDAVGFKEGEPVRFKSGILSPVYVDNRKLPSFPKEWRVVLQGFKKLISDKKITFDLIAGIESAGIPHSAALGYFLRKPSVFVRKEAKDHGTKKRVEGGDVRGKKVLLIEDLVTTGGSSLSGVRALREEGAIVKDCIVIVSYNFKEAIDNFKKYKVRLHSLTSFPDILKEATSTKKYNVQTVKLVNTWLKDPHKWTKEYESNRKI